MRIQPNHSVAFCNFKKCISTELYLSKKLTMLLPGKQFVSASLMRFFPVTNFMQSSIDAVLCMHITYMKAGDMPIFGFRVYSEIVLSLAKN